MNIQNLMNELRQQESPWPKCEHPDSSFVNGVCADCVWDEYGVPMTPVKVIFSKLSDFKRSA